MKPHYFPAPPYAQQAVGVDKALLKTATNLKAELKKEQKELVRTICTPTRHSAPLVPLAPGDDASLAGHPLQVAAA